MKKKLSDTAFSLLELIIASVLVVIVIIGIFAVNNVLSSNNQDYGQRYLVKSETQVVLNHILNNASEAIGSGLTDSSNNPIDQGILYGNSGVNTMGDPYTFCIHQDKPFVLTGTYTIDNVPANNTPDITSDDRWLCYSWSQPPSYQINYCTFAYLPANSYRNAQNCNVSTNAQYLGTSFANPVSFIPAALTNGFSITILNCLNNTPNGTEACSANGPPYQSADIADNPEVSITGSVLPSQQGNS